MVSGRVQALLEQLRAQGIRDEQVLNALAAVPRYRGANTTRAPISIWLWNTLWRWNASRFTSWRA